MYVQKRTSLQILLNAWLTATSPVTRGSPRRCQSRVAHCDVASHAWLTATSPVTRGSPRRRQSRVAHLDIVVVLVVGATRRAVIDGDEGRIDPAFRCPFLQLHADLNRLGVTDDVSSFWSSTGVVVSGCKVRGVTRNTREHVSRHQRQHVSCHQRQHVSCHQVLNT